MKQLLKWFCNCIEAKHKEKQLINAIYNLEGFGIRFVKDTSITLGCFSSNFTNSKKPVLLWKDTPLMTKERTGDLRDFIKGVYHTSIKRKIPPSRYLDELVLLKRFEKFPRITNKFPKEALPKDGFITKYTMTSEGIFQFTNGNLISKKSFNFVITKSGDLKIGNRHHLLGNKEDILAAGSIRFKNGRIVEIENLSGHYKPTLEEALNLKSILEASGIKIKRAKYSIWGFKEVGNGYIELDKIIKTIFIDKLNIL